MAPASCKEFPDIKAITECKQIFHIFPSVFTHQKSKLELILIMQHEAETFCNESPRKVKLNSDVILHFCWFQQKSVSDL